MKYTTKVQILNTDKNIDIARVTVANYNTYF